MNVEITHHIDASEPDADGFHEYHYEYDIYVFSDAAVSYVARSYSDTPAQAHFLKRLHGSSPHLLRSGDLRNTLFAEAVAYLRSHGKPDLQWLDKKTGYVAVPDADAAMDESGFRHRLCKGVRRFVARCLPK